MMLIALDKMCNQQKFLIQLQHIGKGIRKACEHPNLKIKCEDKEGCTCSTKKRKEKALLQGNNTSQRDPGTKEEESSKKILQINVISIDRKAIFKKEMFETKQKEKGHPSNFTPNG